MQIRDYDRMTGEYLQTRQARLDPLETQLAGEPRYLIPAHATTEAPPEPGEYQAAVFRDSSWALLEDHRGRAYYAPNGERFVINALGVTLPEGAVWEDDQLQVTLTPDKAVIAANGIDQALVSVQVGGEPVPENISIEVDGVAVTVALTNGQGQLAPIVSPVGHVFTVRVVDKATYQDAGGCTITAQEI
jgi:hypothetical protein